VVSTAPLNIHPSLVGGIGPFTWSVSSGALPAGLSLNSTNGTITGTPTAAGPSTFTLAVNDPGPPAQSTNATYTWNVVAAPGRNDTIATATPLSNGTYQASLSPYADPQNGLGNPDVDIYAITANPGAIVAVQTTAQQLIPSSPLDTVLDIMDSTGTRLNICNFFPNDIQFEVFNQPCLNDDLAIGGSTDSEILLQVPSSATGPMTFYVRVSSFRGDARPDFIYQITVSGAN
jgi:hypothetical protein